ncbi:hypothetical protein ACFX13_000312 [Malus domestica]
MVKSKKSSKVKYVSPTELVCSSHEVFPATISCLSYARGVWVILEVVVHPITPTKEEKMAPYWNVIFDDVEAGIDATPEDKSKGVADAD